MKRDHASQHNIDIVFTNRLWMKEALQGEAESEIDSIFDTINIYQNSKIFFFPSGQYSPEKSRL